MTEPLDPMLPRDDGPNGREPMLPLTELAMEADRIARKYHDDWRILYFGDFTFHPMSIEVAGWRDPEEPN